MNKIRVGVIGTGYLGQYHAQKYASLFDAELIGLVDTDLARAQQIAAKLNTQSYTDPTQLIGKIDAVSIVVPTVLHYRVAKQFLEHGIHVLLEKPITVTLEQADELISLATNKGLVLQIGHIERFNPAVAAIRPLLQSPRYLIAERAAPFTVRCTDVNVVLDLMIHDLDVAMDLAGSAVDKVSAAGVSVITKEIDVANVRITFQNGCIADIMASRVSEDKKRLLRVFDKSSMYTCDYQTQKTTVSRKQDGLIPGLAAQDISLSPCDTLAEEIHAFLHSVRNGAKPLVSGVEGRRALALAKTITDTIERGITGFVPVH